MKRLIGLVSMMLHLTAHSTLVVRGNSTTAPFGFTAAIQSQTYDRRSGMFYVGLNNTTARANSFTISKATRPSFNGLASFTPVINTSTISSDPFMLANFPVEFLSFSPQTTSNQVLVGAQQQGTNLYAAKKIFALFTDGSHQQQTVELNDTTGMPTQGIIDIESNSNNIFAGVMPSNGHWGDVDSGIAMVGIDATNTSLTLSTKNASAGTAGNLPVPLDMTSEVLIGTSSGADVIVTNTFVTLIWDDALARLFIGMAVEQAGGAGNVTKSVVIGYLSAGALNLQAAAPDNAITGGMNEIAVNKTTASQFNVEHLAVMHASTGPDYLIIDDQAASTHGRRIFAVPLVNDVANPTSATNGTFAKYTSGLDTNHKFTDPAASAGDLLFDDATQCPEAVVGAGNLPLQADDHIADLVVVDDAVYVALDDNNGASLVDSDRGIFYSQAMFDNTGKIIRWTPWTKRVVPFNAFPNTTLSSGTTHNGGINFMEVDAKTGNVWFIDSTTGQTVGITSWTRGEVGTDLVSTLGTKMFNGVYSLLDLDQATRGFLGTTVYRYALFGGVNKVSFAQTSIASSSTDAASDQTYSSSPQATNTDFSTAANFLVTNLPENAGTCSVLEYSRTSTNADKTSNTNLNYFFAGTETGLFVFSENGNGFNALNLASLNTTPFSDSTWQKVESILGQIIDIKTSGSNGALSTVGTLYVIANQSTVQSPLSSTLYSIPFASTTAAMFSPGNIRVLAQTGVGAFQNILQFYGMAIISTGSARTTGAGNKEQLILTTNQGLFVSMADQSGGDGTISAANQTAASWTLVQDPSGSPTTAKTMFNGISGPNTPIRQTAWPFNLQDIARSTVFSRGVINQLSGFSSNGTTITFNTPFVPLNFNAHAPAPTLATLDRITDLFSDGGRRFFIFNRVQDPATIVQLGVLPFNAAVWSSPQTEILTYAPLNVINRFYGIQTIGATGLLLAGTESGAVGLG